MKPSEAVQLVAVVSALCPGQKLEQETWRAWAVVLRDVPYPAAEEAARSLYLDGRDELGYRRIEADDIRREVKRVRNERLSRVDPELLIPPAGMTPAEDVAWRRRAIAAVADGQRVPDNGRGELKPRNMAAALTQGPRRA